MSVDFLICGTQKGGTSALDACCRSHRDILMPSQKELHFFDDDARFTEGEPDYTVYHALFPNPEPGKVRGESTPVYMYWPGVPERIHRYNPAIRLITILRNPIERAYSHWQMETSRGNETLPFGVALRAETARLAGADANQRRVYSYIDRGRYTAQLEKLWSLFGRDKVLVLRNEALRSTPADVLAQVSEFLDIAPFPEMQPQTVNRQDYVSAMADSDRQFLQEVFAADIAALATALDWSLDNWC